ncbi:hypothetical protein LVJ94_31780 [Pendulispora rubella]|uniref:Uncharacterized protein n=1 Tax=Pendulispora rubella TaxID=2741070 RepID=A0ABZ2KSI7_9BACT
MATNLGWFSVRSDEDLVPVLKRLRQRAAKDDMPEGFRIAAPKAPAKPTGLEAFKALFTKTSPEPVFTSTMLLGWQFHAAPLWAQAVSQELGCVAISFFVFEDTWNYAIFDSGNEVAAMEVYALPEPVLHGDVERAASLFGVDTSLFRRYEDALHAALVEADQGEDEPTPFPGDEYAPHDEWAHVDFARRLGNIPYPEEGVEFRWDEDAPPVDNAAWLGLPPRLPSPTEPPIATTV